MSKYSLENQNWIVNEQGKCQALNLENLDISTLEKPYRLYRFLTEIEDIISLVNDDYQRLIKIIPLVRKLLTSSYWLQLEFDYPPKNPGWSVRFLYQEQDFLLTVQTVCWLPGKISPIHNHGTWGIVALIDGQEKNYFWRRNPSQEYPHRIQKVGEYTLEPGEIIGFLPQAIHSVEAMGEEPTVSFNVYGITDFSQRFEFNNLNHTAKNF